MPIGWFDDLADANSYFTSERLETDAWDALTDPNKTKAVENGYNRIFYHEDFYPHLPTYAAATAAQLVILKKANGEMAYYLAEHLDDEDTRKGLQAQAVTDAGVVKEKYHKDLLYDLPLPPFVISLLKTLKDAKRFYLIDIDRDEDESVNTDTVDV